MTALQLAGTEVCEPFNGFRLEFPADCLPALLATLARLRAVPQAPEIRGTSCVLAGEIPSGRVHDLQQRLPPLTSGEGMLESEFARYQPVRGVAPTRPRTGRNPLDRAGYLLQVQRGSRGGGWQRSGGAKLLAARLLEVFTTLKIMWADSGYDGKPLASWIRQAAGITLQIIKRSDLPSFQVVSRRWVVKRTFGWLMRYRRLVRDYQRRIERHEVIVMIMTRRLAKHETGTPPIRRWGGERATPPPRHPATRQDQRAV